MITTGKIFKDMVEKKYEEAKSLGLSEIVLDESLGDGMKVFIGVEPKMVLAAFEVGDEKVYVGAESINAS